MSNLTPGQRVVRPALYVDQDDRTGTVVRVVPSTRQVWVQFDGEDTVRELSTFHVHPAEPE